MMKTRTLMKNFLLTKKFFNSTRKGVLIVGDSHAVSFYNYFCKMDVEHSCLLFWLGPRLMYSIAKKGFDLSIPQVLLFRLWKPDYLVLLLGEIDVRTQLADMRKGRELPIDWISSYLYAAVELARKIGEPKILFVEPVAQTDSSNNDPRFPRVGSLSRRIEAHGEIVKSMRSLLPLTEYSDSKFIPISYPISTSEGVLKSEFTDDGCHLNDLGLSLVASIILKELRN